VIKTKAKKKPFFLTEDVLIRKHLLSFKENRKEIAKLNSDIPIEYKMPFTKYRSKKLAESENNSSGDDLIS